MTNPPHQSLLDTLAKPPPPPSELDELISRDPLSLSSQDIDAIIAYQRQQRARREAGIKTKKPKDEAMSALTASQLVSLIGGGGKGNIIPPSTPEAPKPTTPGGFRRF